MATKEGPPRVLATRGAGADARPSYRRCEDEPIRTPGAIQSYGALIGVKYSSYGNLEVRIASENTRKLLGYGPEQLFELPSFLDVLKSDAREEMVARINYALSNAAEVQDETRLDIFQMVITFPYEPDTRLWCAIHLAPNQDGLIVCEFEAYSDAFYLKDAGINKLAPETPVRMAGFETSLSDFEKSTTSASRPLPAIEVARQRQNKEFSALDIFNASSQAQKQITASANVQEVMDVSVGIVAELTGFHRVMFYTFDNLLNGCVEAEMLNPNACQDVFRGKLETIY
jgi:light-regulated signal transduction histidine kinase (bacteriophytochrome)